MSNIKTVNLYHSKRLIGALKFNTDRDSFEFSYDKTWIKAGFAISPHIPFNNQVSSVTLKRFFQNLFPEGKGFETLLETYRLSRNNIFGITRILGKETTGALTILDEDSQNDGTQTSFRQVTSDEIVLHLKQQDNQNLIIWDEKPRLSIAGLQDKLPVIVMNDESFGFGEGDLASTHILKFQTMNSKAEHLVINELFCMQLAKAIGIKVANTKLNRIDENPVLVVERFDREKVSDQLVKRKHIIDGCQALNLPPDYKYERNLGSQRDVKDIREGVSLPKLFSTCKLCKVPAKAIFETTHWFIYNLLISNYDSHGKNISYFITSAGVSIAPLYDAVNISMYQSFNQELAMAIGDEFDPNGIFAYQLADLCEDCGLPRRLLVKEIKNIGTKITSALDEVEKSILNSNTLLNEEIEFLRRLKVNIKAKTSKYLAMLDEILEIDL